MSSDMRTFDVEDVEKDGVHTLVLRGELDMAPAADLEAMVLRLCAEGASGIVVDLRELTFMGSTGLRLILAAKQVCTERGCDFAVIPGPPNVQRLFEITGLLESMPFRADPGDEAGEADPLKLA